MGKPFNSFLKVAPSTKVGFQVQDTEIGLVVAVRLQKNRRLA